MSRYSTPKATSSPVLAHLIAVVRSGGAAQKRSGRGRERDAVRSTREILMYAGPSRHGDGDMSRKVPHRVTEGAELALTKLSRNCGSGKRPRPRRSQMHQAVTARSNRVRRALSHRLARQHVPAGHVVWVYAITDGLAPDLLAGLTGVGGEQVRAVTEAGLTAVVGSVDERAFGERARAGLMSDLPSIERLGRAHHQVIACVAADGPVLPLRLATVYPDDQTVRTLLGRSSAEFAVILDSLRGTEEWGVKVYAGTEDAAAPPSAEMIDRALTGIAIASRHHAAQDPHLDGGGKCLVLNAAYLVLSDRAGEFTAVARALTRTHQGMGAGLTGPWPPYSFADIRPGLPPRPGTAWGRSAAVDGEGLVHGAVVIAAHRPDVASRTGAHRGEGVVDRNGDSTATPQRVLFWLVPPGSGGCSPPVHATHGAAAAEGMAAAGAPAEEIPATAPAVMAKAATALASRWADRRC